MVRWLAPLTLMALLGAVLTLAHHLNQPVGLVRVIGDLNAHERQAIREVVSPYLDQGLLRLRLDSIKSDLYRLSWPRTVSVRRLWPAGLSIHVDKQQALARWGAGGYLSSEGAVIPAAGEDLAGLPELDCKRSTPSEAMDLYRLLSEALEPTGARIARLSESSLGEWSAELDTGPRVVLGRERLVERMQRFSVVYARVLRDQLEAVGYADARYANGVAVRWEPPLMAYKEQENYGVRR